MTTRGQILLAFGPAIFIAVFGGAAVIWAALRWVDKEPKSPADRWTWPFVHPVLYWKSRFLMAIWMEFPPESWVTRTFNWAIERTWPFSWARRQYSMAVAWMVMQKTPLMTHLTTEGLIKHEEQP